MRFIKSNTFIVLFILIVIILSLYYILRNNNNTYSDIIRENLENQNQSQQGQYIQPNLQNDPLYLTKTNAADITYLKKQMDRISNINITLNTKMIELDREVKTNTSAIQSLNKSLANTANSATLDKKTTQSLANSSSMSVNYDKMK